MTTTENATRLRNEAKEAREALQNPHPEAAPHISVTGSNPPEPQPEPQPEPWQPPMIQRYKIPDKIRPREFILNRWYIVGYLSITAAPGGTGKTSIVDVETVSIALGKNLLDPKQKSIPGGARRVLVLTLEDDKDEYYRRQKGIHLQYGLTKEEIETLEANIEVFYIEEGAWSFTTPTTTKIGVEPNKQLQEWLIDYLQAGNIKVMTVDPLIGAHGASENSTEEMQIVAAAIRHIAAKARVAIQLLHHNRKGGENTSDAIRGSVALIAAARAARMLYRPTEEGASDMGIPHEDRHHVILESKAKENLTPANDELTTGMYRMNSQLLGHTEPGLPQDNVGVAVHYQKPGATDWLTETDIKRIQLAIAKADVTTRKASEKAKDGTWIGDIIIDSMDLSPLAKGGTTKKDRESIPGAQTDHERVRKLLTIWESTGTLVRRQEPGDTWGKKAGATVPVLEMANRDKKEAPGNSDEIPANFGTAPF